MLSTFALSALLQAHLVSAMHWFQVVNTCPPNVCIEVVFPIDKKEEYDAVRRFFYFLSLMDLEDLDERLGRIENNESICLMYATQGEDAITMRPDSVFFENIAKTDKLYFDTTTLTLVQFKEVYFAWKDLFTKELARYHAKPAEVKK